MRRLAAYLLLGAGGLMAACSPQEVADKAMMRTVATVVRPVVDDNLTGTEADAATSCIVTHATRAEREALARDVAVIAGTVTVARIRDIAARPDTQSCLSAAGVPPLRL